MELQTENITVKKVAAEADQVIGDKTEDSRNAFDARHKYAHEEKPRKSRRKHRDILVEIVEKRARLHPRKRERGENAEKSDNVGRNLTATDLSLTGNTGPKALDVICNDSGRGRREIRGQRRNRRGENGCNNETREPRRHFGRHKDIMF